MPRIDHARNTTGRTLRRARLSLAVGGLAAVLSVLGGVAAYAAASEPEQGAVYHGCFQRHTGSVRLLTIRRPRCRGNEVALSWSQGGSPLSVGVDSFGNHASGTADVSVDHPKTGKYVVTFNDQSQLSDRGTIDCATTATLSRGMSGAFNSDSFDAPPGEISTFPGFGANFPDADQVVVNTYDSAGHPQDEAFWLVLDC